MIRRFLSTLLMACYVASQLAALPHSHASQPAGHGGSPHVHGDWLTRLVSGDAHPHAHPHAGGGHHHHGKGHSHSHDKPQPISTPAVPGEHHDNDCVYLPDAVTSVKQDRPADWLTQFDELIAPVQTPCDAANPVILHGSLLHNSPSRLAGGCALYLTLRTLRI